MNRYGDITVNKKGCFILEGEYKTNTNYIIEIHIIIEWFKITGDNFIFQLF